MPLFKKKQPKDDTKIKGPKGETITVNKKKKEKVSSKAAAKGKKAETKEAAPVPPPEPKPKKKPTPPTATAEKLLCPPGRLGIDFVGKPPVVSKVAKDSPLQGVINAGQVIYGASVPGQPALVNARATELSHFLRDHQDNPGRKLILDIAGNDRAFKNYVEVEGDMPEKVPIVAAAATTAAAAPVVSSFVEEKKDDATRAMSMDEGTRGTRGMVEDDTHKVIVPPGKIGIDFEGKPPVITKIYEGGSAVGKLKVGQTIFGATVLGGGGLFEAESKDMAKYLRAKSEFERTLVLKGTGYDVEERAINDAQDDSYVCCGFSA